ncbi:hypothetical protein TorRG33x02_316580 [Trema orientale]|uniref:Uncharacterized protein n=1 Tax=Trema orientale TaxID=63057 RepID=A0A2P5BLU0_TREOI|nr:hypothetical protein TorRG33x02_316580 [Trema orientale]
MDTNDFYRQMQDHGLPKRSSHFRSPYQVRLSPAPSAALQHC